MTHIEDLHLLSATKVREDWEIEPDETREYHELDWACSDCVEAQEIQKGKKHENCELHELPSGACMHDVRYHESFWYALISFFRPPHSLFADLPPIPQETRALLEKHLAGVEARKWSTRK